MIAQVKNGETARESGYQRNYLFRQESRIMIFWI